MSTPIVYQLGHKPIKDHVFSSDRSLLAITKDNTVEIYRIGTAKPQLVTTLKGHDKTVTSVDISPDNSKILTCSQDRNALVWEYSQAEGEYKPTLVLLRINKAATCCRWSPNGDKFAVGSNDRIVAICYYEEENDWWVSKHLRLRSTVTSLDWHPNNVLLAVGSTDGHARVFSTFIKGLDAKPAPSVWGSRLPFQTLCGDFTNETGAWVHAVSFNPNGDSLAYVSHDSSLVLVYPEGEGLPPKNIVSLKTNYLPFKSVLFLGENSLVASGHNCNLIVFQGDESGWKQTKELEQQKDLIHDLPPKTDEDEEISSHDALNMFRQLDLKGKVNKASDKSGKALSTIHQNTVTAIKYFTKGKVSTSGIDGKVVIFNV
ncbi:ARP2/3 actin-organizing complex subunit Sop2 [Yamadazyma tenuis]|uniref:Actin-related protein 2/3 complex subunit n=1 Tax=Candida tenuis (strain ATCC 10573 / BCRC 21748 / CBS 615 / JCM 9827 / NBRC 10315 / NRRL Y-1498 / VKM Y-70) TaxID=590646 RepID=G3B2G5_CANTC|nr:actin-related protein 2/3 complex, subunit 1 [Yamadazyma tenuis ATCC 10573]EGV64669.1 actin-related protein 2/3 complex, subunit 1 [Yamadazyma tenuis ATCC 10573]WEJ97457.1 ARP2/3 actin-organizing complex subunit Sop2 [Yamadazyma tenuis]